MSGKKRIVDKWVNKNFERMILLSRARVFKYQRNIQPECVVSNCYEYLLQNLDKITEENIESIAFNFINMQVIWTHSNTNKEELQTATPFYKTLQFNPTLLKYEADEIDDKVKQEEVYQDRKAIIALYLDKLRYNERKTDKVKMRLLETILRTGEIRSREVAEHFNISHTGAWLLIRDLKGDIAKFKKELNKYDKLNNFK